MSRVVYRYMEDSGYSQSIDVETMDEALEEARDLLRDGDWGDEGGWVTATVVELAEGVEINRSYAEVLLEPPMPECTAQTHEWTSEGEGGCEESPGVWGIGGAAILSRTHCRHCGLTRRVISGDAIPPRAGNRDETRYIPADEWCEEHQQDRCGACRGEE